MVFVNKGLHKVTSTKWKKWLPCSRVKWSPVICVNPQAWSRIWQNAQNSTVTAEYCH